MLPVCVVAYVLLPDSLGGDVAMAVSFVVTAVVIFCFMPRLVGRQYHEEVYLNVAPVVRKKLHRK
jgi:hypothetical protein